MWRARETERWDHTSLMWSLHANCNRDPTKQSRSFSPGDIHPFRDAKDYEPKPIKADITVLKKLIPNGARNTSG